MLIAMAVSCADAPADARSHHGTRGARRHRPLRPGGVPGKGPGGMVMAMACMHTHDRTGARDGDKPREAPGRPARSTSPEHRKSHVMIPSTARAVTASPQVVSTGPWRIG